MVGVYLRMFTFLSHEEIIELDAKTQAHPEEREAQRRLAREILDLVHGVDERVRVERAVDALYSESINELDAQTLLMVLDDAPSSVLSRGALQAGEVDLVDVLVSTGLVKSKNVARQTLSQGGVYVNNRRADATTSKLGADALLADRYLLIRRGRRDLHLLDFS
jgi:tyrosyl-tRNA synthetase